MQKRYLSLDVLRGLTVAMMIIVNNPGSWSRIFPPLRHASWDGCTPCDLAFLIYVIDVRGYGRLFFPFKALGMNALAIFVISGLLMKIIWIYIGWDYTEIFGVNEFMSLLFALAYLSVHILLAVLMYRRKIFIKL